MHVAPQAQRLGSENGAKKKKGPQYFSLPQCPGLPKLNKGNDSTFKHQINKKKI